MINKQHFGRIVNALLCTVMCLGLAITGQLILMGKLSSGSLFVSFVASFGVAYLCGDIIPGVTWGSKVASAFHVPKNSIAMHLVSTVIINLVLVTPISFVSFFISMGFSNMFIPTWIHVYPFLLLVGYCILAIFIPIAPKVATALTK